MGVFSMQPRDPDLQSLVRQWIEKADADMEVARQMTFTASTVTRIREIVGFHCQQAAEKFLKAFLTRYQVEFPKTHDIKALLNLVATVAGSVAAAVTDVVNSLASGFATPATALKCSPAMKLKLLTSRAA
jgi:HEPN domain-containing protein